jgi:xanthine dehydrogenase small subunit
MQSETVKPGHSEHGASVRYRSVTSCLMPLGNANGKHVVTVEGINAPGLNPIQQAFADEGASQCGFCTPGFIVSLTGFCINHGNRDAASAVAAMDGNICRCTGYKSIERVAARIEKMMVEKPGGTSNDFNINRGILPPYFRDVGERLKAFPENGISKSKTAGRILGGGTDLYVQQPEAMAHADINFFTQDNSRAITGEGEQCIIDAAATVSDLLESPLLQEHFPALKKYMKLVSSTQIRNMATIAGNFVNASPIGDLTIFFLALNAQLQLSDGQKQREISLRSFYKGYKQLEKLPGEFIAKISFRLPNPNARFNFEKVSKRTHLDIASVNSAMAVEMNKNTIMSASISAGGVGPVPLYLKSASSFLSGKEVSEILISEVIELAQAEIAPISDARGSEGYKRLLLSQLIKAHFLELFPQLDAEQIISFN